MKTLACLIVAFAAAALCQQPPAEPKPAPADQSADTAKPTPPIDEGEPGVDAAGATVEVGAEAVTVNGEKTFGFQQYRDVPQGAFLRRFDYIRRTEGKPLRFSIRSVDLMQRDMLVHSVLESPGTFDIQANFEGLSRFWGNHGRSVLTEVQRGVFTVPFALRSSLENASDAALPGLAVDAVNSSPQIEVRSFRERGTVVLTYHLTRDLAFNLDFMQERRSGNRPISFGTFIRHGNPNGDLFETPGQELWEPTAYGTTEFRAGLTYTRRHMVLSGEYRGSLFYNHTASLIYQNPFRVTSASATPPSTNPQPPTGGASGGANFRGRFAELQSSLPPDNQAYTFTGSAAFYFPRSSKISGLVSWGRWTQDQAFLPYTDNPAVTVNPGQAGPTAPLTSLAALPQPNLNGIIHTLTGDFVASTRPFRPLQLTVHYNDYDLDNDTQQIHFPGNVAVLNSFWSNYYTGTPNRPNVPLDTRITSFDHQRVTFEAAVKPIKDLTWKGAYHYERWNRIGRQVDFSTENGLTTSFSYAPRNTFYMEGGFDYSHREPDLYADRGGLENVLIHMFDQSNRLHKQGNALFSVNPRQPVIFSGSWFYSSDIFDKSFLGLHQMKSYEASADASFNLDQFSFYAGWSYDRTGSDYVQGTGAFLPPTLRFSRDTRDGIHTAHVGFTGSYLKGKGSYQVSYAVGLSRIAITTSNIDPVPVTSQLNSNAFPFPTVKSQFHEVRFDTSYQISKNMALGFNYLLEPYRLNDFANDVVQPYGGNAVTPLQNDASRFYFLDIGPTNYVGTMAAAYLRFRF